MPKIDYRELLKKYMKDVFEQTERTFVEGALFDEYSVDELHELEKIEREI